MRVQATNFQSWPEFSVEVEGLTVIVGPSNLGKSAMFRALRGAVRNEIEAGHIRKGTDTATVTLHHDGHEATAVRTAKSTSYRIKLAGQEEREVGKLNGATPEDMASWGFNTVDIGGVALDPVFAAQFDAPFLLRSSPAERNAVFGAFSSTEKLDEGRKLIKSDITALDNEAKTLAGEIERKLNDYAALKALLEMVDEQEIEQGITDLKGDISTLDAGEAVLDRVVPNVERLEGLQSLIPHVTMPDPAPFQHELRVVKSIGHLQGTLIALEEGHKWAEALAFTSQAASYKAAGRTLAFVSTLGETQAAYTRAEAARTASQTAWEAAVDATKTGKTLDKLSTLLGVVVPTTAPKLETCLAEAQVAHRDTTRLFAAFRLLSGLRGLKVPNTQGMEDVVAGAEEARREVQGLQKSVAGLERVLKAIYDLKPLLKEIKDIEAQVKEAEADISKAREALQARKNSIKCPNCGTLISVKEANHGC